VQDETSLVTGKSFKDNKYPKEITGRYIGDDKARELRPMKYEANNYENQSINDDRQQ